VFEQWPKQSGQGSTLLIASFRSPHGIGIDLWGLADEEEQFDNEDQLIFNNPPIDDHHEDQVVSSNPEAGLVAGDKENEAPTEEDFHSGEWEGQGELADIRYINED
jgi:hypothetical protein